MFWLLFALIISAHSYLLEASEPLKRGIKRKTVGDPAPVTFEETRRKMLGLRDGGPRIISNYQTTRLPDDIWVKRIFSEAIIRPSDFLKFLRINKAFFTMLCTNHDFLLNGLVKDEAALTDMIWDSEMTLKSIMFPLLRREMIHMDAETPKDLYGHPDNALSIHRMTIYHHTDDLELLSKVFDMALFCCLHNIIPFRELTENIFRPSCQTDLYYVRPANERRRVLDLFKPKMILVLSSRATGHPKSSIFVPALISQYILPAYYNKFLLSKDEKNKIRAIVKRWPIPFRGYFQYVRWACYFITGETRKNEPTVIGPIASHLDDLGLDWKLLFYCQPAKKLMPKHISTLSMDSVFRAAMQWGLDIRRIAHVTVSWCGLSNYILINREIIPEFLKEAEPNSIMSIIRIVHGQNVQLIPQTYDNTGDFVDAIGASRSMIHNGIADQQTPAQQPTIPRPEMRPTPPLLPDTGRFFIEEEVVVEPFPWISECSVPVFDDEGLMMDEEDWCTGPWTTYHESTDESK